MVEEVSRLVALAWGAEAAPQRGPKRELSIERIVDAAVEIADAEGLGAVTMQRVAQTFGYTTMAMYRYVSSKDDLHRLMLDAAGRGPVVVDPDDWRTGLEQLCGFLLGIYRAHPWMLDIPMSFESVMLPENVRVADTAIRAMRTLPLAPDVKLELLVMLSTFVRGYASLMREIVGAGTVVGEATRELLREAVTSGAYPDLAPLVTSGVYLGGEAADGGAEGGGVGVGGAGVGGGSTGGSAGPGVERNAGVEQELGEDFALCLTIWLDGIAALAERAIDADTDAGGGDDGGAGGGAGGEGLRAGRGGLPAAEIRLAEAERELEATTALRKQTEQRVRELTRREEALRARRDEAKTAAKEAAKNAARAARDADRAAARSDRQRG